MKNISGELFSQATVQKKMDEVIQSESGFSRLLVRFRASSVYRFLVGLIRGLR